MDCPGSGRSSDVRGQHARGPGPRRAGGQPDYAGKGRYGRSGAPRAGSGGERESRPGDFRKFEMEEGKFQLSVYTLKDGKYFEVIVDHNSGKVVKTEPITEAEDYTAAQSQTGAMAKAKGSLRAAVEQALRDNAGFRAVSVTPSLKDGRAVADVSLAKGDELKTVSVPLP